jgi:hypothetical protein
VKQKAKSNFFICTGYSTWYHKKNAVVVEACDLKVRNKEGQQNFESKPEDRKQVCRVTCRWLEDEENDV